MSLKFIVAVKGSSKSGNYGHAGRPGKLGGSAPGKKGTMTTDNLDGLRSQAAKLVRSAPRITYDQLEVGHIVANFADTGQHGLLRVDKVSQHGKSRSITVTPMKSYDEPKSDGSVRLVTKDGNGNPVRFMVYSREMDDLNRKMIEAGA